MAGFRSKLSAGRMRIVEEGLYPISFPIDVVYTWVDSEDPDFIETLNRYLPPEKRKDPNDHASRFKCHEELRYSLRSLSEYAPWVNHIYIVTNGQHPYWLADHPKVTVIRHEQIIDAEYLPTFNSHVIGSALHHIPGLSEHYIYFNDDVLLLRDMLPNEAFTEAGLAHAFITHTALLDGPGQSFETANERAAKNARDALLSTHGVHLDRRFAHMYHAQRKDVAIACEQKYAEKYADFRSNKFRGESDLLCCSYLHHYEAYLSGKALFSSVTGSFVRVRTPEAPDRYASLLQMRGRSDAPVAACLNDYIPPEGELEGYADQLTNFLQAYYPKPSPFER